MNILIFGGTKGIGKELADSLKSQHRVYVCSRTAEIIQEENFKSITCDITKEHDINTVLSNMLISWRKIDIVINSAGIVLLKPFLNYTVEDIDSIFDINIKGACLITKSVIPIFKEQNGGRIIHLGSTRSFTVAPNKSMYSISKFALRALNKSTNLEFNKKGIYSSMVCPGRVDITGINPQLVSPKDIIQAVEKIISLPDNMNVEEIIIGGQL
jgi:NADP-dependent 3-hydroxy acid dehydrogenase YdfG